MTETVVLKKDQLVDVELPDGTIVQARVVATNQEPFTDYVHIILVPPGEDNADLAVKQAIADMMAEQDELHDAITEAEADGGPLTFEEIAYRLNLSPAEMEELTTVRKLNQSGRYPATWMNNQTFRAWVYYKERMALE